MVFRNICAETFQNHAHIEAETADPAWQGILKEVRAVTWGQGKRRLHLETSSPFNSCGKFTCGTCCLTIKPRNWSALDRSIGSPWSFPQLKLCKLWQLLFEKTFTLNTQDWRQIGLTNLCASYDFEQKYSLLEVTGDSIQPLWLIQI